jgi:hypothetical protein
MRSKRDPNSSKAGVSLMQERRERYEHRDTCIIHYSHLRNMSLACILPIRQSVDCRLSTPLPPSSSSLGSMNNRSIIPISPIPKPTKDNKRDSHQIQ